MRRFLLTVAAAATALTGTACSDSTGLGTNVAGSYELRTVNGQFLPADVGSVTYEAGLLELDPDGTFVETLQYRDFGGSLTTQDFTGTWDRSGSQILLDYDSGVRLSAQRTSSSRILLTDANGDEFSYQRF